MDHPGALGGQDGPERFPASGRNAYPSGANAFFADAPWSLMDTFVRPKVSVCGSTTVPIFLALT